MNEFWSYIHYHIRLLICLLSICCIDNASAQIKNTNDSTERVKTLQELVVNGTDAERNLKAAEMGTHSMSGQMILNLPVMFGEPDVVKALQTLPGVSPGIEGLTGLYVRGGDNDQNLFMLQGLPLYQVSHLGGIFSSLKSSFL